MLGRVLPKSWTLRLTLILVDLERCCPVLGWPRGFLLNSEKERSSLFRTLHRIA